MSRAHSRHHDGNGKRGRNTHVRAEADAGLAALDPRSLALYRWADVHMSLTTEKLLEILRIGHDTSMRGVGISIREALTRTRYAALRTNLMPADLVPILGADPSLVQQWIAYSEDKRTDGGWYITENREVARLNAPHTKMRFASLEETIAYFVVQELDFWTQLKE